jgi:hypothetical protein
MFCDVSGRYADGVRDETRRQAAGCGLVYDVLGLALLALVALKLARVVTWSWWWVLTPLWINLALAPLVLAAWTVGLWHWRKSQQRLFREWVRYLWDKPAAWK